MSWSGNGKTIITNLKRCKIGFCNTYGGESRERERERNDGDKVENIMLPVLATMILIAYQLS